MSWQDDLAFLDSAMRQGYVGSAPRYQVPVYRPPSDSGHSPWAVSSAGAPSWIEFASR